MLTVVPIETPAREAERQQEQKADKASTTQIVDPNAPAANSLPGQLNPLRKEGQKLNGSSPADAFNSGGQEPSRSDGDRPTVTPFRPEPKSFTVVGEINPDNLQEVSSGVSATQRSSRVSPDLLKTAEGNIREAPPTSVFDRRITIRDLLYSLRARLADIVSRAQQAVSKVFGAPQGEQAEGRGSAPSEEQQRIEAELSAQ